jgi:rod shape-determining protein MreB
MAETIFVGIDLGTSRTSITASNGFRKTVWSYVGYPKDHVALKRLGGREIIYGQEALENRMSVHLYRPLAGASVKQQGVVDPEPVKKAIRDLLEYVVREINAPADAVIYAVIGAPAQASVAGKATILEAAANCIDSVIVCSEPFAVAYGLDFLDDTLVIDIGAGTTDLCRVHGSMPSAEDQRTHYVAGDSIDQSLSKLIQDKYPEAQFSINMVRAIKERHASVSPKMEEVEEVLPVGGKPTSFNLTEQVYSACYTIVPPTVQALQDLIATYDPEFQAKMRNNILLGGGGSQIRGLGRAIEKGLSEYGGGKVTLVEEPQFAGSNGALKIALDMPTEFWAEFRTNRELAAQGMSGLVS